MSARHIVLLGATGTIGRAVLTELLGQGARVSCLLRAGSGSDLPGAVARAVFDPAQPDTLTCAILDACAGKPADALISCMASRTGGRADAWAIDHDAHIGALKGAQSAGIGHMVLLSAICVQKPLLEFQRAKLAFERALIASGMRYSIVRPTAFFKSLSGQIDRLRAGKPFLVFGDGGLTACKPISNADLARFVVGCLDDPGRWDAILPVGGPGPALTPREQGALLFSALGREPHYRHVPVAMMDAIIAVLSGLGRLAPSLAAKAELARIGRYYATESMLMWDAGRNIYDPDATPGYGTDTLADHYARLVRGEIEDERGDHAVF